MLNDRCVRSFAAALARKNTDVHHDVDDVRAVGAGVRVEFEVEGAVSRPFGIARDLPDFSGAHTVANRIYGISDDDAGATASDAPAQPSTVGERKSESHAAQAAPNFEGGDKRAGGRSQEDIPEALTDEQIAAMSQQEAMAEYSKRRSLSRTRTDLTQEVKQRLLDEAEKCRARAVEAKKEAPSS